jgi:hypothetical protein
MVMREILPVVGGLFMVGSFVESIKTYLPAENSYSSVGSVGGVFILGIGSLLIGLVIMLLCKSKFRPFFSGQTLATGAYLEDIQ